MKAMKYKCSHQVAAQIQASFKVLSVYAFTRGPVVVKSTFYPDFPYSWGFYSQFNTVWHWLQPPPPYPLKPSAILPRHPGDQQVVKCTFCPDFLYSWDFYPQFNTVWHWLQPPPPYQLKPSAILPRHPGDQQAPRRHWPERSPALLAVRPMPD